MFSKSYSNPRQLKIVDTAPSNSAVGIGLAPNNHNPAKYPGWMKKSCGYHSDDGALFKKGNHVSGYIPDSEEKERQRERDNNLS